MVSKRHRLQTAAQTEPESLIKRTPGKHAMKKKTMINDDHPHDDGELYFSRAVLVTCHTSWMTTYALRENLKSTNVWQIAGVNLRAAM